MSDSPVLRTGAVGLVVGASSGVGAAVAEALAARGCRLICAGRRLERLRLLAERLGSGASALALDVTDPEATRTILDRLPVDLRQIDILVNCAGHDVGGRRRFDLGTPEEWAAIIETNLTGVIRVCHAIIPQMLGRGTGHVVNIGSVAGLQAYAGGAPYCASKFAITGLTDALRLDYKDTDLRVTDIQPGLTRTEFAQARFYGDAEKGSQYYDRAPGCLLPEDVARAVMFALEQPSRATVARLLLLPTRET
jgi:NADP-dependent 3-hydroxy acid dehydrogenase YdfG